MLTTVPETPPANIYFDNSSSNSVLVHWSPPLRPNGVITRYTLYIGHDSGAIDVFHTDGRSTTYNITNLLPYQHVTVAVTASTSVGEGPSSTSDVRTAQARKLLAQLCTHLIHILHSRELIFVIKRMSIVFNPYPGFQES